MNYKKTTNGLSLEFSNDELLVLSDWLFRFNEKKNNSFIKDESEQKILWDIEAILEKNSDYIFDKNYDTKLSESRKRIMSE